MTDTELSPAVVHQFDNGLKVYDAHLIDLQRERYRSHNVHEAEEESVFLRLIDAAEAEGCFVNIGAAIGYYAILAKLTRPDLRVVAYEPLRAHRRHLRQNLGLNGLSRRAVELHSEGVAAASGYSSFWVGDFSSMIVGKPARSGVLEALKSRVRDDLVRTIPLSSVCERVKGNIDLVQMDIQGAEQPVLEASLGLLRSGQVRRWLIGTHSLDIHRACARAFESCGYEITVDEPDTTLQPDGILVAERS